MRLNEIREKWEQELSPVIEIPAPGAMTVVLSDEDGEYHVHHYMCINTATQQTKDDAWDVSADLQGGTHEEVVDALMIRHPAKRV
jgi:hypothetical protein